MRRFLAAAFLVLATFTGLPAAAQLAPKPGFPQERYQDFKPDAAVIYGKLPNGLRYGIQKWPTPKGEVSIRLRVAAGALMERPEQSGLAHFLEHMAFNGSENVPESDFDKILAREGLQFGPDSNAYTSWDETVYMLDMPNATKLPLGLSMMRETAGRLLLAGDAIDRERGIIVSEERARDNPGFRQFKAWMNHALEGTLIPARWPIGDMKVVREAPRDLFVDLYKRYYTPERTFLVVVGDIDPVAAEAEIKRLFANWAQPTDAGPDPSLGTLKPKPGAVKLFVDAQVPTSIQLYGLKPYVSVPDTSSERRDEVLLGLGQAMLNERLERISRREGSPITSAETDDSDWFKTVNVASITANATSPAQWKQGLEIIDLELRRALEHGFTAEEFRVALANQREAYQRAVSQAGARRSAGIAGSILESFSEDVVHTSAEDDLAWFNTVAPTLTVEGALAQFRELWGEQTPQLFIATGAPIEGGEAAIKSAYEAARARPAPAPAVQTAAKWDYVSFGTPGRIVSQIDLKGLDATQARFGNNVRLVMKPTKFETGRVRVQVRFGDGALAIPATKPGLAFAIQSSFIAGGLGRLDVDDLNRALAGRSVSPGFGVSEDAFVLSGTTTPQDLELQLQLLAAYFTDPAWRPDGLARLKSNKDAIYRQIDSTPGGVWGTRGGEVLRSGDRRFGFPTPAEFDALTLADARAIVDAARRDSAVEVLIIGDIEPGAARAAVAKTFGALPVRAAKPQIRTNERKVMFPAGRGTTVLEHKGRSDQSLAMVFWPLRDYGDGREVRAVRVLENAMQARLNEVIREELGDTYSPGTDWAPSQVSPGYGTIGAISEVKPDQANRVLATMERIAADLAAGKIDQDLFDRAKRPLVADFEETTANNPWWMGALSNISFEPIRLARTRDAKAHYADVTLDQVKALAKTYLVPGKARLVKVVPGPDAIKAE
jgi:zinc protease